MLPNNNNWPVTAPVEPPRYRIPNFSLKPQILAAAFGVLILGVLVGVLAVSVWQSRQSQEIKKPQAAGCTGLWPADPETACGKSTQLPAQGAANVSLTPDFHWDYEECVTPSGCANYSASVYLVEGSSYASNKPFARADIPRYSTQAAPVKDAHFADFYLCDYGNVFPTDPDTCHTDRQPQLTTLKPSTTYWWNVTPFFEGIVHAEHTWRYTFTTGAAPVYSCNSPCTSTTQCPSGLVCDATSGKCRNSACPNREDCICPPPPAPLAACQMVEADKDLSAIKIGDTITVTGYGSVDTDPDVDSVDKIEFRLLKDNQEVEKPVVDTTRAADKDHDKLKYWKASKTFTITSAGSYSVVIKVHQKGTNTWKE